MTLGARLGFGYPDLLQAALVYRLFRRRYRPEPKSQPSPRWGGWRLWLAIEPRRDPVQGGLFGHDYGARYHGKVKEAVEAFHLAVLRPAVLDAVDRFVAVNQASAAGRHVPGSGWTSWRTSK